MSDDIQIEFEQVQDLGNKHVSVFRWDEIGATGVARLLPDAGAGHLDAMAEIRDVLEEHYGERIEELGGDEQQAVIERVVIRSDDLPHIEYRLVDTTDE